MNAQPSPGFDGALAEAQELSLEASDGGLSVTLVRDVLGRITAVVDDRPTAVTADHDALREVLAAGLAARLGPFVQPSAVRPRSELPWMNELEGLPETVTLRESDGSRGRVLLVERTVTGADWSRPARPERRHRITLYGFKGGVGRSTAAFLLAERLAQEGRCVLVVDLDLESPGVGALLQDDDDLPDHGVVDELIESAVGAGRELDLVTRSRRVAAGRNGEVWLAPAGGRPRQGYTYLPKLNRIYTDVPGAGFGDDRTVFAERLDRAVRACERGVTVRSREPDVVLLDSRAGIHDIAAVAITRLADLSLLFAADTPQTWAGYRELFAGWARVPDQARAVRERLKLVAVHVAASGEQRERQLAGYRDRAQQCFADTLYDDLSTAEGPTGPDDPFSFGRDDINAPHSPLPIPHVGDLVGLDPATLRWQDNEIVRAAYGDFVLGVADLVGSGAS